MIGAPTLAWLQLRKEKLRLLVAIAGVAFAVVLMLMQLGFYDVVIRSATKLHRLVVADLVVIHTNSLALQFMKPFPRSTLYQTLAHPDVQSVVPVYMGVGSWRSALSPKPYAIFVVGFPPEDRVLNLPAVDAGRELLRVPEQVLFDSDGRREYGPVGDIVRSGRTVPAEVSGRRVTVAGIYQFGATFFADGAILASDETFLRIFQLSGEQIQLGLVRVAPGADIETVRDALAAILPPPAIVLTRAQFIEVEMRFWRENTAVGFIFTFGAIMGFVVGAVIVYQILFADVSDHLPEYATLKAMGYSNLYISTVVGSEALILSVLGFLPGVGLSWWLFRLCHQATQLPMELSVRLGLQVFALTVVMCAVSGAIAVRKVQRADPADVF